MSSFRSLLGLKTSALGLLKGRGEKENTRKQAELNYRMCFVQDEGKGAHAKLNSEGEALAQVRKVGMLQSNVGGDSLVGLVFEQFAKQINA